MKNTFYGVLFVAFFALIATFIADMNFFKNLVISPLIIGIVLGLGAVGCILYSHQQQSEKSTKQGMYALLSVWLGYALIDILLKYTSSLGVQFAVSLNLMFFMALILSILYFLLP